MDILTAHEEVFAVTDAVVREAALPDGKFRLRAVREAALDEAHRALQSNALWRDEQVNVVRHHNKRVQLVMPFVSIVLKCGYEKVAGFLDLEDAAAIEGCARDKEGSMLGRALWDGHGRSVNRTSAAEAAFFLHGVTARLKPCP